MRAHLRDTTGLDASDPDFPVCARSIGGPVARKSARTDSAGVRDPTGLPEPMVRRSLTMEIAQALDNITKLEAMMAVTTSDTSNDVLQKLIDKQLQEVSKME